MTMMRTWSIRAAALAAALSLASFGAASGPASADPAAVPDADDVVGVGSDSTAGLLDELGWFYNQDDPAHRMASFDAIGWPTIVIRPGIAIDRPMDSVTGLAAVTTRTDVDYARTTRGWKPGDPANVGFVRFAEGDLRWMAGDKVAQVASLTHAQLVSIYNCVTTNWSQVGGPNLPIVALIPAYTSGLRDAWAARIGLNVYNLPACVRDTVGGTAVRSNDTVQVAQLAGAIAPVTAQRYQTFDPAPVGAFKGEIAAQDTHRYRFDVFNAVRLVDGEVPPHVADVLGNGYGTNYAGDNLPWICRLAPGSDLPEFEGPAQQIIENQGFRQVPVGDCGIFG